MRSHAIDRDGRAAGVRSSVRCARSRRPRGLRRLTGVAVGRRDGGRRDDDGSGFLLGTAYGGGDRVLVPVGGPGVGDDDNARGRDVVRDAAIRRASAGLIAFDPGSKRPMPMYTPAARGAGRPGVGPASGGTVVTRERRPNVHDADAGASRGGRAAVRGARLSDDLDAAGNGRSSRSVRRGGGHRRRWHAGIPASAMRDQRGVAATSRSPLPGPVRRDPARPERAFAPGVSAVIGRCSRAGAAMVARIGDDDQRREMRSVTCRDTGGRGRRWWRGPDPGPVGLRTPMQPPTASLSGSDTGAQRGHRQRQRRVLAALTGVVIAAGRRGPCRSGAERPHRRRRRRRRRGKRRPRAGWVGVGGQ